MMIQFLEPVELTPMEMSDGQLSLPWSFIAQPGDVGIIIEEDASDLVLMLGDECFYVPRYTNCDKWVVFS